MKDIEKLQKDLAETEGKIKSIEVTSVEMLKAIFDVSEKQKIIIKELLKPNLCPYCNENKTDSIDPNVLCLECRENFGHSFFNEL